MKALIVDDERLAREELKSLLKENNKVEVVGECSNAEEAKASILTLKPDLIFLDIQMPGKDGFEMLEELPHSPNVIFVTAYDEYAIKAFEYNALDYLLKPVETERLGEAIAKLSEVVKMEQEQESEKGVLSINDQVFVKDGEKCWFVRLKDVRLFESIGNYVRIYFDGNKPLILKSLNSLEQRLDQRVFFRANRKYIINLNRVERIENWFNGGLMVQIEGGVQIEISRRQASRLKEMMSL
jgi:two-component system LytT family response regulator